MKKLIVIMITCLVLVGCELNGDMKKQNESMFFYGTWDAGFFDGYDPSTVTFEENAVTTKQNIDGREVA